MSADTYFRVVEYKSAKGEIMRGRGERPLTDREPLVESILEGVRPPALPDRGDSVYMRKEREFSTVGVTYDCGYVHIVEPIGRVDRRDLAWIGVLQNRHHKNERLRKNKYPALSDGDVAKKYWSGAASDKPIWEWVAKEARVIEVDADPSCVRPNSHLLDVLNAEPPKAR